MVGGADTQALRTFLDNVLMHVASVATQERRHRYWEHQIFRSAAPAPGSAALEPIEGLPPEDTVVLLGFVRSDKQLAWIRRTGLYNMRADLARNGSVSVHSRQASAQVLLLYNAQETIGAWRLSGIAEVFRAGELVALGYPAPRGEAYVCVQMREILWEGVGPGIEYARVRTLAEASGEPFGSPVVTSLASLTS
jgi:hypothetical protein